MRDFVYSLKNLSRFLYIVLGLGMIVFVGASIRNYHDNPLENILRESEDIPNYVVYETVYSNYGVTNVSQICEEKGKYYLSEVFCVKDGKAYFKYTDYSEDIRCWAIGSVDLLTSEFQTCCKMSDPVGSYDIDFHSAYEERNGYYLDGQIVLTDHKTVLTYDIDSQTTQTYAYRDYSFPECTVYGEYIDFDTIRLNIEGPQKHIHYRKWQKKVPALLRFLH